MTDTPFRTDFQQGLSIDQSASGGTLETPILLQYWHKLLRWKWVVLAIIAGALAIGIIATLLMTPQYTAQTRLEISREGKNITNVEGIENIPSSDDDEFYQTQYSNLASRSLATRVARSLRLMNDDAFFASYGVDPGDATSSGVLAVGQGEMRRREQLAVELLLTNVSINPIPRSRLVDINYTSSSPDLSARIADQWAKDFIAASIDRRFASTSDARRFLEQRLADLAQKLEESERRAVQFAAANDIVALGNVISPDGRSLVDRTLVSSDLEALNAALVQAISDRIAAESRARVTGASEASLNNATLTGLRQRRAEAAAQYAQMMAQFQPEYPPAKALQQQIAGLDRSIAAEEARVTASRSNGFREAAAREADLRARVEALKGRLSKQQDASIQYNIYKREADTNRQLYDGLLQRYKEIGVAGVAANNIAIVDHADVPQSPSSPKPFLNLAISLVAGLAIAFIAVLILEQIDEGLREPDSMRRLLDLPLLGVVPAIEDGADDIGLFDRKSALSEAYLSIVSSLSFSTDHGFPRSLMVTSTRATEGKTTSSVAIAQTLARVGKRVLLVDGDLRSPSCHTVLGLPNEIGLSNYLVGANDWQNSVQETSTPNLSLLGTGPVPPNAAELYSGDRFPAFIAATKGQYDHVILDAPPVMGLADAPLISRTVEGVAYVIEIQGAPVRGLRAAISRLRQANAHLLGGIVTKVGAKSSGYGYGYGYGYSYGKDAEAA